MKVLFLGWRSATGQRTPITGVTTPTYRLDFIILPVARYVMPFLGNWQTDHIEITLGKNLKTFKFQKIVRTRGFCRCLCPCHTSTALIPTSQIRQKKMMIIFSPTFSLFPSFHYFRLSFCSFFLSFFSLSLSSLSLSVSLSLSLSLSLFLLHLSFSVCLLKSFVLPVQLSCRSRFDVTPLESKVTKSDRITKILNHNMN